MASAAAWTPQADGLNQLLSLFSQVSGPALMGPSREVHEQVQRVRPPAASWRDGRQPVASD